MSATVPHALSVTEKFQCNLRNPLTHLNATCRKKIREVKLLHAIYADTNKVFAAIVYFSIIQHTQCLFIMSERYGMVWYGNRIKRPTGHIIGEGGGWNLTPYPNTPILTPKRQNLVFCL